MPNLNNITKPKTKIVIILDKSGSMASIKKYAIDTFNEQLQTIKKNADDTQEITITLVQFDDEVEFKIYEQDIDKANEINEDDYIPGGMTALNDAIGFTINKLLQEKGINNDETSVLMTIISDGYENASKEYKQHAIADLIDKMQKTNRWTFSYLGANVDIGKIAKDYNFFVGNIQGYDASDVGLAAASVDTSRAIGSYMGARTRAVISGSFKSFSSTRNFYDGANIDDLDIGGIILPDGKKAKTNKKTNKKQAKKNDL